MKTLQYVLVWFAVYVWLQRFALGAGAGYVAIRLWQSRKQPLIWRLALYVHGFAIEALVSIALLFLSKGVHLTWKFATVMILGAWVSDMVRIPMIIYLIKGPGEHPLMSHETSGAQEPDFWRKEFRLAVRDVLIEEGLVKEGAGPSTRDSAPTTLDGNSRKETTAEALAD